MILTEVVYNLEDSLFSKDASVIQDKLYMETLSNTSFARKMLFEAMFNASWHC